MKEIIMFLLIFILVYLFYFIFVINKKKALKKLPNGKELTFLKYRYKLNYSKINIKSLAHKVALTNAFILSSTVTIISLIDNFILALLIALLVLIPLILICYHLIGTHYQKQGGK